MPVLHAKLSASGAKRWLNCPGSVQASELYPSTTSIYAEEGTLAHSVAEETITTGEVSARTKRKIKLFYEEHDELNGSVEEMLESLDDYIAYVQEEFYDDRRLDPAAVLMTEQRVDFSKYVPGGFGTSDVILIRDKRLHIIDLKYGKGVEVSAEDNPQLSLYALGAIDTLESVYDIDEVVMTIYQPRIGNVSTAVTTRRELEAWGNDVVIPGAKLAASKDAPMAAGEWCQFCPHKAACRERARLLKEMEEYRLRISLTPEEIGEILSTGDMVKKFIEDVEKQALADALDGEEIPGWKVVEGRSNRKLAGSEDEIIRRAEDAGFDRSLLYETKMLGLTAMETLMGKKTFAKAMDGIIEKPAGKPTLVPESDRRPAIVNSSAEEDFAGEFNGGN